MGAAGVTPVVVLTIFWFVCCCGITKCVAFGVYLAVHQRNGSM